MATKYELINILRESNPDLPANITDEELWNMMRAESGIKNLPKWEQKITTTDTDEEIYRNIPESEQPINNIDVAPDESHWLKKTISSFSLADEMLGEGFTGKYGEWLGKKSFQIPFTDSTIGGEDFWKNTFINSSTNLIHQALYGENKYEPEEYDNGFIGDAASFLFGMIEPASILSFGIAGRAGIAGANIGQNFLGRKFMKDGMESLAKKSLARRQFAQRAITALPQRAADLGTFMAIHGAMAEAGSQGMAIKRGDMDNFDVVNILKKAVTHGFEGAAIGGVIGVGLDGGLGTLYGRKVLKEFSGKELSLREKITKSMQHPMPRVAYEGTLFQLSGNVFHPQETPSINTRKWWEGVVQNTLNFGGLKLMGTAIGKIKNTGIKSIKDDKGKDLGIDATIISTEEMKRVIDLFKDEAVALDNVIKESTSAGINIKEIQSIVEKAQKKAFEITYNEQQLAKDSANWEKFKKITDKINNGEIPQDATKRTKEQTNDLIWANEHGVPLMLKYKGVLENLKNNKDNFYNIIQNEYLKRPLTKEEKKQADVWLNIHDELISTAFGSLNEALIPISNKNETNLNKTSPDSVLVQYNGLVNADGKPVTKWMPKEQAAILQAQGIVSIPGEKPTAAQRKDREVLIPGEAVSSVIAGLESRIKKTIEDVTPETKQKILKDKKKDIFGETKESESKGIQKLLEMKSPLSKTGQKELERIHKESGKTIGDLLSEINLTKEQTKLALIGIQEFTRNRKGGMTPFLYKRLFDYWAWLKKKGVPIEKANREYTQEYFKQNKWFKGDKEFQYVNDAISAFYGGTDAHTTGFMDKYVKGSPNVFVAGVRATGEAKSHKVGMPAPKEQSEISKRLVEWSEKTNLYKNVERKHLVGIADLLIETGTRFADIKFLKIENIDWQAGKIINWHSRKKGHVRQSIPIKEVLPHVWDAMVSVKGDRTSGELFIDSKGKSLGSKNAQNKINEIFKEITKDLPLIGEKGYSTQQDFRRAVESDLSLYLAQTQDPAVKAFFERKLTARKPAETRERYVRIDELQAWKDFRKWRADKAKVKETTKGKEQKLGIVEGKPFETVAGMQNFVKKHLKNNPGLKVFVSGDRRNLEIAGSYLGGVVNLFHGKANMHTFFHENAHRHKEMVYATKNKNFIKLWERGEKLASEWAKKNDTKWSYFERKYGKNASEEYLANKIADVSIKFEKGGFGKFGQWFKTFFSQLKKIFLPKNLKQQDIANILGKKVQKGFEYAPATMKTEWLERGRTYDIAGLGVSKIVDTMTRGGKTVFKLRYLENGKTVEKWKSSDFLEGRQIIPSKNIKSGDTYLAINEKGNVIEVVGKRPKFQFAETVDYVKNIDKLLEATLKKYKISETEKLNVISSIAELSGLPSDFKINLKANQADLISFHEKLSTLPVHSLSKNVEVAQWLKNYSTVEKIRIKANVKDLHQKEILELMGVSEGKIERASVKQLKEYQALLHTQKYEEKRPDSWIEDNRRFDFLDKETKDMIQSFPGWKQIAIPLHKVYEGMGLKNLSNKLLQHVSIELHHIGRWIIFEEKAMQAAGGGRKGKKNFKKWSNHLYLLDRKRYLERKQNNMLNKEEISFINNAMSKEWINGKTGNPRYMINSKTKEGKLVQEYYKFTDYFPAMLEKILSIQMNTAQLEKWKKENNVKWIKDNFYVSRVLSKEFRKKYNPSGRHFEKLVNSEAEKEAVKLVEEKHGKNYTSEQYGNALEHAKQVKWAELSDMFTFSPGRYSSRFLQKRHIKLPEVVNIDGKRVQVYETSYDRTVSVYGQGMSKFLANVEVFPEFAKLKGFESYGADALLGKLEAAHPQHGSFIKETLYNHLGMDKTINSWAGEIALGASRYYSTVLAKIGLSFPTSGLKNFLLGSTQTITSMKVLHFTKGLMESIHKENRMSVLKTGGTELGMRHFEELPSIKKLDKIFKFGLMKPFENLNRYVAVLAGRHDQRGLVEILRTYKPKDKKYIKAIRRMKKFYNLTDKQIELLKKHGLDDPIIQIKMEALNRKELSEQRALQNIYEQLDTYAHINTQGSSQDIFMPYWTTGYVKPHTLYKRMAYAATINTFRNLKEAYDNRDVNKFINYAVGTYISGTTLDAIRWHFLGTPSPETNSPWWQRGAAIAVKGELFGILSEFGKLAYDGNANLAHQMYPATHLHSQKTIEWAKSLVDIIKLPNTHPIVKLRLAALSTDNFAKQSVSLYSQTIKLYENAKSAYNKDWKQSRLLGKEFYKEKGIERPSAIIAHENSPYWNLFQSGWNNYYMKGKIQEWNKIFATVFYGTANNYLWKGATEDGIRIRDYNDAYKAAAKNIKSKIKSLNPNNLSILTTSEYKKWMGLKYRVWLNSRGKNYSKKIDTLEKVYLYHWRKWWNTDFIKFLNEYSSLNDKKYFKL